MSKVYTSTDTVLEWINEDRSRMEHLLRMLVNPGDWVEFAVSIGLTLGQGSAINSSKGLIEPFLQWVDTGATVAELSYIMKTRCKKPAPFNSYFKELNGVIPSIPYKRTQPVQDIPQLIVKSEIPGVSQFAQEVNEHLDLMKDINVKQFFTSKDPTFTAHKNLFYTSVDDEEDGVNRLLIATGVPVKPGYLYDIIPDPTVAGSAQRLITELLTTQWSNTLMKEFIQTLEDKLDFPEPIKALNDWQAKINKKIAKKMSDMDTQNEKHNTVRKYILDAFKVSEYKESDKRIKPIMDMLNENGVTTVSMLKELLTDIKAPEAKQHYGLIFAEYSAITKAFVRDIQK